MPNDRVVEVADTRQEKYGVYQITMWYSLGVVEVSQLPLYNQLFTYIICAPSTPTSNPEEWVHKWMIEDNHNSVLIKFALWNYV